MQVKPRTQSRRVLFCIYSQPIHPASPQPLLDPLVLQLPVGFHVFQNYMFSVPVPTETAFFFFKKKNHGCIQLQIQAVSRCQALGHVEPKEKQMWLIRKGLATTTTTVL